MKSAKVRLTSIKTVTPAPEAAVLFIPALLFVRLALWTTVTVDAVNVITFSLVVAWGHAGNFSKVLLLPGIELIVVVVTAI